MPNVAVGLASQRVTVRQIDLPELPEGELADDLRLQAADQLPIPVDEALLDYVPVDRHKAGDERFNVRLLLVAAESEMVERLLTPVTAAKLRPVRIDLDAFALLPSLASTVPVSDAGVIVDIGATVTRIAVHRAGSPLFVRMFRLGGEATTRQLQTALELKSDRSRRVSNVRTSITVEGQSYTSAKGESFSHRYRLERVEGSCVEVSAPTARAGMCLPPPKP